MGIDFYYFAASPPCRAVYLAAQHMGIDLNLKSINILAGEQMAPEYLVMNPQHTVPTLDDNGFVLTESRAILQYMANKYSEEDDTLYPKDPEKRAVVDQRIFFDMGTLYSRFAETYYPVVFGKQSLDLDKVNKVDEALGWLEEYVGEDGFVTGNELTIADFTIIATLSSLEAFNHDFTNFPGVITYFDKCKSELKGYNDDLFQEGVATLAELMKNTLENA